MSLPDGAADLDRGENIPEAAAQINDEIDTETRPYLISFSRYNKRMCQIPDGLSAKQRKDSLVLLRDIGVGLFSETDIKNIGGGVSHVVNAGDYTPLFRGLHTEVDLKEARINNSSGDTGRIFFYTIDSERIFYFVAIRGTHLDTSHR